ncbi:MAG: glycoside hydrolase family 88 protein [Bacteroidota bacterium]|nr:glycoside hydrolase family 88 protein [Bacteroidota bacterium]
MKRSLLIVGVILLFIVPGGFAKDKLPSKKEIIQSMTRVCDWQLTNLKTEYLRKDGKTDRVPNTDWVRGAFLTGLMAQYYTTQKQMYLDSAIAICSRNNWECGRRSRHADDLTVGQTYLEIYRIKRNEAMMLPVKQRLDAIIAQPMRGPVVGWEGNKNWSWCDALFMAPPVFARMFDVTKNMAYLDTMNILWTDTYNLLYDKTEKLFYRDTRFCPKPDGTQQLSVNGKKIFWGRGNGWVVSGLVRVLQYMPVNYPARGKYEQVFKEMCEKIATLQGNDGLWRASLLDYAEYPSPETSGSGFFCYAMAWGINNGLLPAKKYLPVVLKAWKGLNWAIDAKTGMLGWVQAVGADPRSVSADETQEYGAGAFLLAGSELAKMAK